VVSGLNSVATTVGRLGEDFAFVRAASPLAPGAVLAVADSDALDSGTHDGVVAAATADSVDDAHGVLVAANEDGVSEVVDIDESASYPLTRSIEWESAAEETNVITDSLDNGCALPIDVLEEARDLLPEFCPSSPLMSGQLSSCNLDTFEFDVFCSS